MASLEDWLTQLDLGHYAPLFIENAVDLNTLQILSDADLKELGLPFGPRKRVLKAIEDLKRGSVTGERRQLTVLFCDMVRFSELAGRLDPEVLQSVIQSYEDICASCVAQYNGYVFQRLGDGIVAFFGYPVAHEDEANRAIHAGLGIIDAFAKTDVPHAGRLRVRIGIATGLVVVSFSDKGAVGETMNLASRLQGIADPDTIVISERVHKLAGGAFEYHDLGERALKGIRQASRAYLVKGISSAQSRFEASTQERVTALVGRTQEIRLLLDRWSSALAGKGQVVFLSGEPGIGKSRIVSILRQELEGRANSLRFQCSPYHTNSAFYPIIHHFENLLNLGHTEAASEKLDKLETLILRQLEQPVESAQLIAGILSIPFQDRYGAISMSAQKQKEQTIRALVDLTEAAARKRPTLVLFEDLHWADPTTLEVLDRLIERAGEIPLLAVLTSRGSAESRWLAHANLTVENLSRLTREQSAAMVLRLTANKPLPDELMDQIIDKTDGVPLFVEELTKALLESGELADKGTHYSYAGSRAGIAVPATLRDSLMARLDRLATAREIAQIGAAIGREFSYELISSVVGVSGRRLTEDLERLVELGLVFQRGAAPNAVYAFKHALVQDAAYDSLLKSRRQQLHGRIATALVERFPATRETAPELLAHHHTAAGAHEAAEPLWRRAGEIALQRFALREAVAHLEKGLAALTALSPSAGRDLKELELRTLLGPAVVALRGWAAPEVSAALEPAWSLAELLSCKQSFLPILHGLWVHYMSLGRLVVSLRWAQTMLDVGAAVGDENLVIVGHRAAASSHFWMGNFVEAREHSDRLRALYDFERHRSIVNLTNADPLTGDGIYRVQYLWMLGYPDQALAACREKDDHARRRNHPFDMALAWTLGAEVFDYRREPDELLMCTGEAERLGREHHVPLMSEIMSEIVRGIALLRAGAFLDSARGLGESIRRLSDTGHGVWIWYLRALWAEALACAGDLAAANAIIDESVARLESAEERAHLAEVLRLKGWILTLERKNAEAECVLNRALAVARQQQAKSWELRVATTLARVLSDRGEYESARELLSPVFDWFTEGFETKDLIEAQSLLKTLERKIHVKTTGQN